ncbi:MAG: biosynthetic-type acetolactate synthase large subunit [Chitinivibrionales bacterium]|nr:biosynthetic-type acetolactate synthase large subunit [Chitinivibrionales bacterium]
MSITGAEIVVQSLIAEGVEVIFGYPGGVVIPLFDALYKNERISVILTRHEQAAAHAADGYSRASGKVGVCLSTSGPGATNLVTGIATAFLDSIPLVALTGQVSTPLLGTDAFQEADMVGISRPITKHNFLVKSIDDLPKIIKQAFYIARTGRPGPVLVDIPVDVSKAVTDRFAYPQKPVFLRGYQPKSNGDNNLIQAAAAAIKKARKPLIFAGGGVISANASVELARLVELTSIPVTTSLMGLGGFSGTHPLFLGMPGMHGTKAANYSLQNADLLIAIGARFDDRVTGHVPTFAQNAIIVHIDIDAGSISKIIRVDIPIVGDAKNVLRKLNELVETGDYSHWLEQIRFWRKDGFYTYKKSPKSIKPQSVIEELYRQTGGDAIIATEVGQNQMWTAHFFKFDKPRTLLTSGGLGTMGFGMPAAMGAAIALKRPVIDIAGDGSIQMNIQELATISLNKLPVKIIILNNGYLGMVRQWQELFYQKRYSSTCLKQDTTCGNCDGSGQCSKHYVPDFVMLAKSYGIASFRAVKPHEVNQVLEAGLEIDGPALMEFMVEQEENVFPMVPVGRPIDEIMEGL